MAVRYEDMDIEGIFRLHLFRILLVVVFSSCDTVPIEIN